MSGLHKGVREMELWRKRKEKENMFNCKGMKQKEKHPRKLETHMREGEKGDDRCF